MKVAVYLVYCLASCALLVGGMQATNSKQSASQLLEVGEFHGDEVRAKTGDGWLGLFLINGEYSLLPSAIKVESVRDDMVDGENGMTGKKVSVNWNYEPIFLIKGIPLISRPVPTIIGEKQYLYEQPTMRLELGKRNYELNVVPRKEDDGKLAGIAVVLSSGKETQTLRFIPDATETPENMAVIWAGDLDGDGELDLYLDLSDHYNVSHRMLLLSSAAGKGKMLREVAEFRTTGC